jgi:DUF1009 family protein
MSEEMETLGLIAGGGQFPLLVARAAKEQGLRVVAVAHRGETDSALEHDVDEIIWIKLGQLGRLIKALNKAGAGKALMAGSITKKRMFENIQPDLKGIALASKLALFHDDGILRAVSDELAEKGIEVVSCASYMPELLAPSGCLTSRRPGNAEKADIRFGWKIAKELGRLDVGQSVVVRRKTVLALEAIDGTDETILRGGKLAKRKAVVVKVSKPGQDLRFDLPTVGLETLHVMSRVEATVLAIEAGKTLMFNRAEMIEYADQKGISIISYEDRQI